MQRCDVAVVGAGVVGLATANALAGLMPGSRVVVLEKEPEVASHQSGRNSGVIHSGLYYAPGSIKARLCVRGAAMMAEYCEEHGIEVRRLGKVIVATEHSEMTALEALLERGTANGVKGLEILGPAGLRELEPACSGVAALWSPTTSIVDFKAVARALASDLDTKGGEVWLSCGLEDLDVHDGSASLTTSRGTLVASRVVTCAGLQADRVARLTGAPRQPAIVPFRGSFWRISAEWRDLVRGLVYPAPHPTFPFLGVHFTPRVTDDDVWVGPTAAPSLGREAYRRPRIDLPDALALLGNPGFWRFGARNLAPGIVELARDRSKRLLFQAARRYIPDLPASAMLPGPVGIRAQAISRSGGLVDDFVIDTSDPVVTHVRNAPSPAATSSLAIGEHIAKVVLER